MRTSPLAVPSQAPVTRNGERSMCTLTTRFGGYLAVGLIGLVAVAPTPAEELIHFDCIAGSTFPGIPTEDPVGDNDLQCLPRQAHLCTIAVVPNVR